MQIVSEHQISRLSNDDLFFDSKHNSGLRVGTRVRWYDDSSVIGIITEVIVTIIYNDTVYGVDWKGDNPRHSRSGKMWTGRCFGARLTPVNDVFMVWNGKYV